MSSEPKPPADPTPEEIRLGALVDEYQSLRSEDATIGVGTLRGQAGELFPELAELAECLDLLQMGCGHEAEAIPGEFGPYELESLIDSGVSGKVYRARLGGEGPLVALKVIRQNLVLDATANERFHREMRIVAQLDHPHSVRVVDHGEVDGQAYIAMELIEGGTLSRLIDRIRDTGSRQPDEAWLAVLDDAGIVAAPDASASPAEQYARRLAGLFAPAARALAAAFRAGLVHRDLKPGNLFLSGDGRLVVGDFGLAKIVGEEITSTIAVMGTPGFMSPEQATGHSRDVDTRTDIYGLGASLYRALTLRHPIEGDSFNEVLAGIQNVVPEPITGSCRDFPRGLARCVARCLEKDPRDRYADADALADDLERIAAGRRPRQASVPAGRRAVKLGRRYGIIAAASLAAVLVGYLWFTWPGTVEVHVWPAGSIAIDGQVVGADSWEGRLPQGEYELTVTHPLLDTVREAIRVKGGTNRFRYRLSTEKQYDEEVLAYLASLEGMSAPVAATPERYRGFAKDRPIPAPEHPKALEERLERWPVEERMLPSRRLLAIQELRDDGLPLAAYAAALALWHEDESQPLPLKLALGALKDAGYDDSLEFATHMQSLLEIEDE